MRGATAAESAREGGPGWRLSWVGSAQLAPSSSARVSLSCRSPAPLTLGVPLSQNFEASELALVT